MSTPTIIYVAIRQFRNQMLNNREKLTRYYHAADVKPAQDVVLTI